MNSVNAVRGVLPERLWVPSALFAIVALIAVPIAGTSMSMERTVIVALINLILAIGLYIFVGNSGVWSFGHMSFALLGGYVAALLSIPVSVKQRTIPEAPEFIKSIELTPTVAVLVAALSATLVAGIVAIPVSRISGLTAGLATVSLLIAVSVVASQWQFVTRGNKGLSAIPRSTTLDTVLTWTAAFLVLAWIYQRSSFGIRLRASKSDEIAAAATGISVPIQRGIAFVLSAFVVGAGGALFALQLGSINPNVFYLDYTFLIITMLVIGGAGSLTGVVVGALSVSALSEVLRQAEAGSVLGIVDIPARPGIGDVVLGIALVVMLIYKANGLTNGRELALPTTLKNRFRQDATKGQP